MIPRYDKEISWAENINHLAKMLYSMSVRDHHAHEIDVETGFARWRHCTAEIRTDKRQVFLIGNGASSSMASHFATDIAKNGALRAQVFTDSSLLTALSNDICFEEVFAEPLRWYMQENDMLVAISSSGASTNIIRAVETARQRGGCVITLSAMSPGNTLRQMGDLNFYIKAKTYGHAETAHAAILHHWMDLMEITNND